MAALGRELNGVFQDPYGKTVSDSAPLVRSQSNGAISNTSKRSFNMPLQRTDQNNNNYYDQQQQQQPSQNRQDQQEQQQQSQRKLEDDGSGMSQFQQICQKFQLKMEDIMNIMQGFQSKNGVTSVSGGSTTEGEQLKKRTEVQALKRLTEEIFESQPREQVYSEDQEEQVFSEQAAMEKQNSSCNRNSKTINFNDSRNDPRIIPPPPPGQFQNDNQQQKLYISTCNSLSQKLNSCDFHLDLESENVQSRRSSVLHYSNPQQHDNNNNNNQEEHEEYSQKEQQQYPYPQVSSQLHQPMKQSKGLNLSEELQCQVRLFEDGFAVLSINNGIALPKEEENGKVKVISQNIHLDAESFGSQSESFSELKAQNISNRHKTKEHADMPAGAYGFDSGQNTENSPDKSEISFTNQTFSNSINASNLNGNVPQMHRQHHNNLNTFNLNNLRGDNGNSLNRLDSNHAENIHTKINTFDSHSSASSLSPRRDSRKDDNLHRSSKLQSPLEEINRGMTHSGFGVPNSRDIQKLSESEQIKEMKKKAIYQDPQGVNQHYSYNQHLQQQVYPSFRGIIAQDHIEEDIQSNQNHNTQGFHNVDLEYQSEELLSTMQDNTSQLQKHLNSFGDIRQEYFSAESSDTQQQQKYFQQQNGESKQQEFREEMCDAFSLDPRNKQTAFQIASVGMMNSQDKCAQEDQYKSKEEHHLEFKNDSAYSTPVAETTESIFFQQGTLNQDKEKQHEEDTDGDNVEQTKLQRFLPKIPENHNNKNPQKNEILLEKYAQELKRLQQENSLQRQEISELNGKLSGIQESKRDFELVISSLKQNLDWVTSLLRKKEEDYLTLFEKYNGVIEKMQRIEIAKISSSYSPIGNKENTQLYHNTSDSNSDYTKNHANNSNNSKVSTKSKINRSSSNSSSGGDTAHQISGILTESINNNNNFTQLRPPIVRNVKRIVNYDDPHQLMGKNTSNSSSNHVSNENSNISNINRGMPSSNVSSIRSQHSFSSQEHTDTNKKHNRISLSPSSQQKGIYQDFNVKTHSGQQLSIDERISQNGPKQQSIDSARNTESTRNSSRHRDLMDSSLQQQQQQISSQQQLNAYTAGSANNKLTAASSSSVVGSSIIPVNMASRGYTDQFKKQKSYQNTQGIDGSNNKQSLDELRSFCLRKK